MRRIERVAIIVNPDVTIDIIKAKKDDNRVLECAVSGDVDYLTTGDKRHILPRVSIQGMPIVSVAEFLKLWKHRDESR